MATPALLTLDASTTSDNVGKSRRALEAALSDDGPAVVFSPTQSHSSSRDAKRVLEEPTTADVIGQRDVGLVVATSGTTGPPRLVMLSRAALRSAVAGSNELLGGTPQYLLALPLNYIAGAMVLIRSVMSQHALVSVDVSHGFDVAAFVAGARSALTSSSVQMHATSLVPTQLHRILRDADATELLSRFDAVLIGGAACPPKLLDAAKAAGVPVVTTYGMTETCGGCTYDGRPMPGLEVAIDDGRRIRLRGPQLFSGYLADDTATSATMSDGWFVTPDLGQLIDGSLQVIGRVDDVVQSGGVNVSLVGVEDVVATVVGVESAAVVAIPDDEWGSRLVAVVSVATSQQPPQLAELRNRVSKELGPAAAPKHLMIVDQLPLLDSGKLDRTALRTLVAAQQWRN